MLRSFLDRSSIFNLFGNFSDCSSCKVILPACLSFWPKLVIFDQLANVLTGLVNVKKQTKNARQLLKIFYIPDSDFSKL